MVIKTIYHKQGVVPPKPSPRAHDKNWPIPSLIFQSFSSFQSWAFSLHAQGALRWGPAMCVGAAGSLGISRTNISAASGRHRGWIVLYPPPLQGDSPQGFPLGAVTRQHPEAWWPISFGFYSSVCRWYEACCECQLVNPPATPKVPFLPLPFIKVPFERIGVNLIRPLVWSALLQVISQVGIPKEILTD